MRVLGIVVCVVMLVLGTLSFGVEKADYTLLIYLNGTDLESTYDTYEMAFAGNATKDLNEMIAGYKENGGLNVIVQTGGTNKWANDFVSEKETQRFELTDSGFKLVESMPNQNMGYKKTLSDFIIWGNRTYPADKTALILWNHGSGPVHGYGHDELFEGDSLHLEELEGALKDAKDKTNLKFEVIGFDACLMASIEVADMAKSYAKYLVASEELEPGHGWNYQGILNGLYANPQMDGVSLGKIIVDTYYQHAVDNESVSDITLSVIDLSKIDAVVSALEALVTDATPRMTDELFFYAFARSVVQTKSFGGNTEQQGYTDIIDLKSFSTYLSENQSQESKTLSHAIDQAVLYKVEGTYTKDTSGLALYFPYRDKDYYNENMALYNKNSFSPVYKTFLSDFNKRMTELVGDGQIAYTIYEPTEDNPYYQLVLEENEMNKVYYVYIDVYEEVEYPNDGDILYRFLGTDFLVRYDEESNTFFEDFSFGWTFLDNEPLSTYVTKEYDTHVEYEAPMLYKGEQMNLIFAWVNEYAVEGDTSSEVIGAHYEVYGFRRGIDSETGMPDKNMYQADPGDILTPLYGGVTADGREVWIEGNPITITGESEVVFKQLKGKNYQIAFRFLDFGYNSHQTDFVEVNAE